MTSQIFISYSKKDSEITTQLANDLREKKFKVWFDVAIGGGDEWRKAIETTLKSSEEVIVVLSPNSIDSDWVQYEGTMAYTLGKQIIPILVADLKKGQNLPPWLSELQYINFVLQPYEKAFAQLVEALTPPNPIQDLLDQEVEAYRQTGDLIGEAILRVIAESVDTLTISEEAQAIIDESRQVIEARRQEEERLKAEKEEADRLRLQEQALRIEEQEKANRELRRRNLFFIAASALAVILFIAASIFAFQVKDANAMLASLNDELQVAKATIQANLDVAVEGLEDIGLSIADLTDQSASRKLAEKALSLIETEPEVGLLLGVEAFQQADTPEARAALLRGLQQFENQPGGKLGEVLTPQVSTVTSLVFDPDGRKLAAGDLDGDISLWEFGESIQQIQALEGHRDSVLSLAFSSDGSRLFSGGADRQINFYDVSSGSILSSFPISGQPQYLSLKLNDLYDPAVFDTSNGPRALGMDASYFQGEIDWQKVKDFGVSFVFLRASGGLNVDSRFVENWEKAREVGLLRGAYHFFDPNADPEQQIQFFYNTLLETGNLGELPPVLDFERDYTESRVQLALSKAQELFGKTPMIYALASQWRSNLGSTPWASDYAYWVPNYLMMDWSTGVIEQLQDAQPSFLPDAWDDWTFWQFTASGPGAEMGTTTRGVDLNFFNGPVEDLYSFAGVSEFMVAAGNADGGVSLWNSETGEAIHTLSGGSSRIHALTFSPDGTYLAMVKEDTSNKEYNVILWNRSTGASRFIIGSKTRLRPVVFSPDGAKLAVGNQDGTLNLWDIDSRQAVYKTPISSGILQSLVFSRDGAYLAYGTEDGRLAMVDVATGQPIGTLLPADRQNQVSAVTFDPNGDMLISGNSEGDIISWEVSPQSWVSRACQIVGRNFTTGEWDQYIGGAYRKTCGDF